MINSSVSADIWAIGGSPLLIGKIVQETEKAVKIDYEIIPFFQSFHLITYNRTAWIPKSLLKKEYTEETLYFIGYKIPSWFANKKMKGHNIKPYYLKDGKRYEA